METRKGRGIPNPQDCESKSDTEVSAVSFTSEADILKSQFSDAVTSEECSASSDTVSLSGFQQEISQSRSEPTSSGASTKAGFHKKIYCRLILGHDFIN